MKTIEPGSVLIADPFLKDANFLRTAIFLCEHKDEGSFGFVLNKRLDYVADDIINELTDCSFPVFFGGPVQQDTLHFLHCCPKLITGGEKITNEIYWGGEFDELVFLLQKNKLSQNDVKLFLGYSGWGEGQLEYEFDEKAWLNTYSSGSLIFSTDENLVWKNALKQLGKDYEQLIHYPIDPQLN